MKKTGKYISGDLPSEFLTTTNDLSKNQQENLSQDTTLKTTMMNSENQETKRLADLHDSTIRDILCRPDLFFSNPSSLEEGLVLLIALRGNFQRSNHIIIFRKTWIEKELAWTKNVQRTLHETLSLANLLNFDLHVYLLSKMVKDFDVNLHAEREFPQ